MSQRAQNIKDDGSSWTSKVNRSTRSAKSQINVARTMSDEGTIVLAGRGGDDFV